MDLLFHFELSKKQKGEASEITRSTDLNRRMAAASLAWLRGCRLMTSDLWLACEGELSNVIGQARAAGSE